MITTHFLYFLVLLVKNSEKIEIRDDLQGKLLGEDTQIYTKSQPSDSNLLPDDMDTAIMRRGAQIELSQSHRDPEAIALTESSLDLALQVEEDEENFETYNEGDFSGREPVFDQSATMSSNNREEFAAHTTGSLTHLDDTSVGQDSRDLEQPMLVNPQSMAPPPIVAEESDSSTTRKGTMFIAASLLGVVLVVAGFFYIGTQTSLEPMETEVRKVESREKKELEGDYLIVSKQKNAKKLEVRCNGEKWKGVNQVAVPDGSWTDCVITGRDQDRRKLMVSVEELEKGIYTCFVDGTENCEWEE